jgi:hypothetical protein
MFNHSSARHAGAVVAAFAVAASLVGAGSAAQAAPAAPAANGAHWLAGQLTDGVLVDHSSSTPFNDYGPTIDTAFAFQAIGGHRTDVRKIRRALANNIDGYITGDSFGDPGSTYAGPTAKALVLAQTTGGDPTDFGGVNLVKRLTAHVDKAGPAVGRIADESAFGDFANTVGQILAVRGLMAAKNGQAGPVRKFLLMQQCRQGYFRLNFSKPQSPHQGCRASSPADPDTTSYAVAELWKTSRSNAKLRVALERAVSWLAEQQRKNGSFEGGTSTAFPNTNSTGLAGWALGLTGQCRAARAAAAWVAGLQVGPQKAGSKLAGQKGAIAYRAASLKHAEKHGITAAAQDEWWRATSQAAPVLTLRHGC